MVALTLLNAAPSYAGGNHSQTCDPLEKVNRGIYKFNKVIDSVILKPTAKLYHFAVPPWFRSRVSHFLSNLTEPLISMNALLQGDVNQFFTSFWRFVINSSLGIGGLFDIAGPEGLKYRSEDFGQTLGRYGIGACPYIVLPILGPSNARDTVGTVVDIFTDPFNYILDDEVAISRAALSAVEQRERVMDVLDDIERTSFDPYVSIRSMYQQYRESAVENK